MKVNLQKRITVIFSILGLVSLVFVIFYKYVNNKYHNAQNHITQHNNLKLKINSIESEIEHLDTTNSDRLGVLVSVKETEIDVNKLYYTFFDVSLNDTLALEEEKNVYLSKKNDILLIYDIKKNYKSLHDVVKNYVYSHKSKENQLSLTDKLNRLKNESNILIHIIEDDLNQVAPFYKKEADSWLLMEQYTLYLFFVILIGLTVYAGFHIYTVIIVPIKLLFDFLDSKMNLSLLRKRKINDEITDLVKISIQNESEITHIRKHLKKLGEGEFKENLALRKEALHPLLTKEIQLLQKKLVENKVKNERYNWGVEGIALLNQTLNLKYDSMEDLVEKVLSELVNYTKARQGAIFVINRKEDEEVLLPKAVYAFGIKKKVKQIVHKGEGLLGEVWEEKKTFYYSDIPKSHMRIKSGLGDAKPTNLLLTPVMSGLEFYGAIELGFFHNLEKHEIEFIEKVAVNLAIALSGIDVHNKTKQLLSESQKLSSTLKTKEAELEAKIQQLKETHEETQRRELQNQRDIKLLAEKYELQIQTYLQKEREQEAEVIAWKQKIETAKTDNDTVRALNEKIKGFQPQIDDLKETIKIKDMRIEKLRKKLRNTKQD